MKSVGIFFISTHRGLEKSRLYTFDCFKIAAETTVNVVAIKNKWYFRYAKPGEICSDTMEMYHTDVFN